MTFNLYGPANMTCAGAPTFSSVKPVNWNGTYVSAPFIPTAVGTYQWVVMLQRRRQQQRPLVDLLRDGQRVHMTVPNHHGRVRQPRRPWPGAAPSP